MKHIIMAAVYMSLGLGGMNAANQRALDYQKQQQAKHQAIVNQYQKQLHDQAARTYQLQLQHAELCKQFKVKPKGC